MIRVHESQVVFRGRNDQLTVFAKVCEDEFCSLDEPVRGEANETCGGLCTQMFDTQPEEYNKKMILLTETQWEPIIIESYFTPNIKRKNILFYIKTKARKLAAFVFSTVSELNLTSINV